MLLLLDNCEHVIDAAAGLAAALISGTPGIDILATSREPLEVRGERVYRLGPLSNSPEPSPGLTAKEAAAFPAVQLFVERVTAIVEDFALTDANAALVVAICRRLDGLPLAIEFAAPRVEVLGVEALAACLGDSLRLLGGRCRGAMPLAWDHASRHRLELRSAQPGRTTVSARSAFSRAAFPELSQRLRPLPWTQRHQAMMRSTA